MYFAVNATALRASGALTILKQFLDKAENTSNKYIVFISDDVVLERSYKNVIIKRLAPKGWLRRIYWDFIGFDNRIKSLDVNIDKVISLQNTTVNTRLPQIIYLHQPIPFSNVKFSMTNISGFKLSLYKWFYSYFIFLFSRSDTRFFVQTKWMKEAVCSGFNIEESRVYISKPDINLPILTRFDSGLKKNVTTYIYPATYLPYKNHIVLIKALSLTKKEIHSGEKVTLQVTLKEDEFQKLHSLAKKYGVSSQIQNLGVLKYEDLLEKYMQSDGLLFPSFLETYGLPLVEAAALGKRILCSDLPYARDVLEGYEGVDYIPHNNPRAWAEKIRTEKSEVTYIWEAPNRPTWDNFFNNL
ncbi:glycosyltransferase [Vibrio owensii]|uniref:glycosyltransferase n=1 Tax=Vibrio owensii TaxID=696485 RepID=UPI0021D03E4F